MRSAVSLHGVQQGSAALFTQPRLVGEAVSIWISSTVNAGEPAR